jgi:hypothetical protein
MLDLNEREKILKIEMGGERERERERIDLEYRKWIDFFFFERIGIVVAIHGEKLDPKKMCENTESVERITSECDSACGE